jgi:hypothetical protein
MLALLLLLLLHRVLQALAVCTSVLLLYVTFQQPISRTVSLQLGTAQRFALRPAQTGSRLVVPQLTSLFATAATTVANKSDTVTLKSLEWFLSNPSTHCARHQLPAQGHVSQSPFVSEDTFRSMSDYTMDLYRCECV